MPKAQILGQQVTKGGLGCEEQEKPLKQQVI